MGNVGVVAGILDHAGHRAKPGSACSCGQREGGAWPRPAGARSRPDRESRRRQAPRRRPSPPRRRRRRSSSRGAVGGLGCVMALPIGRRSAAVIRKRLCCEPRRDRRQAGATSAAPSSPAMSGWPAPGRAHPGCLTLEVAGRARQADAIVHDALVDADVVGDGRDGAQKHLRRQARRPAVDCTQEDITALLIRAGPRRPPGAEAEGRRPLHLRPRRRGGAGAGRRRHPVPLPARRDLGLRRARPAPASRPTMRGVNKAIILATGHAAGSEDDLDWAALARTGQPIVVYMGLKNLPAIADRLAAGGLAPIDAGRRHHGGDDAARSASWSRRWARSPSDAERLGLGSPALIVVGGIVAMRAALRGAVPPEPLGMTARGLIIGAPRSGSGKTSVTIGLLRALARRGMRGARRQIRPRLHRSRLPCRRDRPAGRQSRQLGDGARRCSTASPREARRRRRPGDRSRAPWACSTAFPAEPGRSGAAADLARLYRLPVLLVLDVSGQSQTAAAVAKGFADLRPGGAHRRRGAQPAGQRAPPAALPPRRSRRSACRWSARSCAIRR